MSFNGVYEKGKCKATLTCYVNVLDSFLCVHVYSISSMASSHVTLR